MTATLTETVQITEAGVYDGMPDEVYHGDPVPDGSLSSSGAKLLLPPSCPAKYRYEQINGRAPKKAFDFGHAAHHKVLGVGAEIVVVDRERWDTKAVKEEVAEIRAAGKVPLKPQDAAAVEAMAEALRQHPFAGKLFEPGTGRPEQSLFWVDDEFGVWRRARIDWLRHVVSGRRLLIPDYKSCDCADPDEIRRSAAKYGYHSQGAFYIDAVKALDVAGDVQPAFLLVCQEKEPPYLVTVVELDAESLRIGRDRNRRALEIYRDCKTSGVWPGYSAEVELISLPPWAVTRHLEEIW